MTEGVVQKLRQISETFAQEHLRQTYYMVLSDREREALAECLIRFVGPLRMACEQLTEDEVARLLYEALSHCLRYDEAPGDGDEGILRFTYAGGICYGSAVCLGIAELYTLLGSLLGLRVQTVIGYGGGSVRSGGLHAWNMVWLKDGDDAVPYHIDLTWDLAGQVQARGYRYYLKSDAFMEAHGHRWLKDRYPPCPSSRSDSRIPAIPSAAVQQVCRRFENMRHELGAA